VASIPNDRPGEFKIRTHSDPDFPVAGINNSRWVHAISETNLDVQWGNGTVTNIMAYRKVNEISDGDLDGTDLPGYEFHTGAKTAQEQFSNELRYAGTFADDKASVAFGAYWFEQTLGYSAYRQLDFSGLGSTDQDRFTYGGFSEHKTWGVFGNVDYQLYDELSVSFGARYTYEEKDIEAAIARSDINSLPGEPTVGLGGCSYDKGGTDSIHCAADFIDDDDWSSVTPRIAVQYYYNDSSHVYFSWSKGFRSGGYNVRNTAANQVPGPWDKESQNTWELGMKSEFDDGRVRFNVAFFLNQVKDMIRETIFNDEDLNTIQQIRNTADADITGAEIDLTWLATDNLVLFMNAGYLDGEYKEVIGDLDRSGVVDSDDKNLVLPRLARWTGSVGGNYDIPTDMGLYSMRVGYSHRTSGFFSDSNIDDLSSHDELTAGLSFITPDGKWKASLFGKNLLDQVQRVTQFTLPGGVSAFSPIKKGRVIGVELEYQY
ncbi:MAG: TonB-dependent receptor, partial [Pseudomonadales bacterium]|nr:TonB-dependent receptor [Pseudomonadales bacterium]